MLCFDDYADVLICCLVFVAYRLDLLIDDFVA